MTTKPHECMARDGSPPGDRIMQWDGKDVTVPLPCVEPGCPWREERLRDVYRRRPDDVEGPARP